MSVVFLCLLETSGFLHSFTYIQDKKFQKQKKLFLKNQMRLKMVQLFEAALYVRHRSACVEVSVSLNCLGPGRMERPNDQNRTKCT